MGFEDFDPHASEETTNERFENAEEISDEGISPGELLENNRSLEENASESAETGNDRAAELWPPRKEKQEEKTAPSLGKATIATVALVGTLAAGATEAMGGTREANTMFDELDSATKTIQKAPAKHHEIKPTAPKERRKDLSDVMERVDELGHAYMDAKTDGERDRYATQIAETLITGGAYARLKENTIQMFTATLLGAPVEVQYIILDGVARGSLTDNAHTILHKTHEFQFSVQ